MSEDDYLADDDSCGCAEEPAATDALSLDEHTASSGGARSFVPLRGAPGDGALSPGGGDADDPALADGVRIEIRQGEIVITIRRDVLAPTTSPVVEAGAGTAVRIPTSPAARGFVPDAGRSRSLAFVGLAAAPADKYRSGYSAVRIRKDLIDSYSAALRSVHALGGLLTSSGGIRDLGEKATPGRSTTSLHYTGRAIDLFIYSGMQGGEDPYLVTRAGGTDANPEWEVFCVSSAPLTASPLYDASLIMERDVEAVRWVAGVGYAAHTRRATCFSLTKVLSRHGWTPIPARSSWKTVYTSCEWWHFQNASGMVTGRSTFGEQLEQAWNADRVRNSGLALGAIWAGRSFRASGAGAVPVPSGGAGDPVEKILWMQTVLIADGATLSADGKLGARTREALERFQSANAIPTTAILDATTEIALVQRALERLDSASFTRVGIIAADTVDAIVAFQRRHALKVDGRTGPKTRAAMVAALTGAARPPIGSRAAAMGSNADGGAPRKRRRAKTSPRPR